MHHRSAAGVAIVRHRLLVAALACAWLAPASARDAEAPRTPPAMAAIPGPASATPPVPLLWKVSDADNAVYLLGSFHLLRPSDYPLSKDVDAAFADAEAVVFELPPEEMASPQLGMQMAQAALRSDGRGLDAELPATTAAALQAWATANAAQLAKTGMAAANLQLFEPWFVALLVTMTEFGRQGLDPALGLDAHMAARAAAAGKPTSGLETGAEQIAFLDGMDRAEQLQFLQDSLDQARPGSDEVDRIHALWRTGDVDGLRDGLAVEMRREYPALYRRINTERNDAWLPKIEQRLLQGGRDDTLFVVGALHVVGEDGVVEKLRAKGYEVERICSACAPVATSSVPAAD